jgi:hypothetical protein
MRIRLLAALLCGMFHPSGRAQIVLNPPKDPGVISVNVELVNVLCSVRDRQGAYVKGLNQDDFEIREDGKRQPVTHFAREVETPMTVALLLDVSGAWPASSAPRNPRDGASSMKSCARATRPYWPALRIELLSGRI